MPPEYLLLNVPRWSSASSPFVSHGVATFDAAIRTFIFSLNNRIRNTATSSSLLTAFLNSDLFLASKTIRQWYDLLYMRPLWAVCDLLRGSSGA